jgi:hypothetical protein
MRWKGLTNNWIWQEEGGQRTVCSDRRSAVTDQQICYHQYSEPSVFRRVRSLHPGQPGERGGVGQQEKFTIQYRDTAAVNPPWPPPLRRLVASVLLAGIGDSQRHSRTLQLVGLLGQDSRGAGCVLKRRRRGGAFRGRTQVTAPRVTSYSAAGSVRGPGTSKARTQALASRSVVTLLSAGWIVAIHTLRDRLRAKSPVYCSAAPWNMPGFRRATHFNAFCNRARQSMSAGSFKTLCDVLLVPRPSGTASMGRGPLISHDTFNT